METLPQKQWEAGMAMSFWEEISAPKTGMWNLPDEWVCAYYLAPRKKKKLVCNKKQLSDSNLVADKVNVIWEAIRKMALRKITE